MYIFCTFAGNQMTADVWAYFFIIYLVPLISTIVCANVINVMLLWLQWLCNIIWSEILWYLQHCSFYSGVLWLYWVFCVFILIVGLIFLFLWRMILEFLWGLYWICRLGSVV
jgi:hypothetical protein